MRVERIPNVRAVAERKTLRSAALGDPRAIDLELSRAQAVLRGQILGGVRSLGRHRRIELERLQVQLDLTDVVADPLERTLERAHADRTPRTRDVRNQVDSHESSHL